MSNTTTTPTEITAAITTFCLDIWSRSETALLCVVPAEEGTGVEVTSESVVAATVEKVLRLNEENDILDTIDVDDVVDLLRLGEENIVGIIDEDDVVDLLPPSHAETELPVYNTKLYNGYWLHTHNYSYLL